jgi:hypothetical protein
MSRHYSPRIDPRPLGTGPFFDYVLVATHDEVRRARALRATVALQQLRLAESRSTSAEQRWEGEGGNTQGTPGGEP